MSKEVSSFQLTIDMRKNRIRIYKSALIKLGCPLFILLLVNPEEKKIVVMPSEGIKTAHRIRWDSNKKSYELTSTPLIRNLLSLFPQWDKNKNYRLPGKYICSENVIEFYMNDAVIISNQEDPLNG